MSTDFFKKINELYDNLPSIISVNNNFDKDIIDKLETLKNIDIGIVTDDLKKGNYLGNRKIDIDLALNNANAETEVSYESATLTLNSGIVISIPFRATDTNNGLVIEEVTSYTALYTKVLKGIEAYNLNEIDPQKHIVNYEIDFINETIQDLPTLLRIRDTDGSACNIDRVTLSVYGGGSPLEYNPAYYWTKTTSALEVLANRVGDIIALGQDIDKIIALADKEDEIQYLYDAQAQIQTVHDSLVEIVAVGINIGDVKEVSSNKANIDTIALHVDRLSEIVTNIVPNLTEILDADTNAILATQKAQESLNSANASASSANEAKNARDTIIDLNVSSSTLVAGTPASVAYNSQSGLLSFGVPQGVKGERGEAFSVDALGVKANRANYNNQPKGFTYLATDEQPNNIYFKMSSLNENNWSIGSPFGQGETGVSISSVAYTSTTGTAQGQAGETDTYTISLDDGSSSTFKVKNGIVPTKTDLGLNKVNNTSDAEKNNAIATLKNKTLTSPTINNPLGLSKNDVGLSNVNNTSDLAKPISTLIQNALNNKVNTTTKVNNKALSGNISLNKNDVDLGSVDNTSDLNKPISTLQQNALNNKVNKTTKVNNKALDGNISLNKTDVGLGNVNNTSDASKPISEDTQNALDSKSDINHRHDDLYKLLTQKDLEKTWFGRIWNVTDDVYKRIGLGYSKLGYLAQNEFDTWLATDDKRVNDNDITIYSDLTLAINSNTKLPYGTIARKVVTNTGVVTDFDHITAPGASEQIMTQVAKTYYIKALVVAGSKTYDIDIVSTEPFSINLVSDLGFTSVTSIAVWNPTAGISSGTVLGSVITSALHPAFSWHDGREADLTFIGSFWSIVGRSNFAAKATANINIVTARTQNSSFGTDFGQHDFWNNSLIQLLAYIERGTNYFEGSGTKWDGYSWHTGATSYPHNNGLTLALKNKTGTILDGSNRPIANSYRGIENYHSGLWVFIDGINVNSGAIHLAKAGASFVSNISTSPYFPSGKTSRSGGWANIESWQAGTFIPSAAAGGTDSTKVTDKMIGAAGWRVLLFGGRLNNPGNSGLSCWLATNASSSANWNFVSRSSLRKFF